MTDQTMRIVRDTDGHGYTVYDETEVGGVVHKSEFWIRADRLHLLATAAQAALAEQNSGVMACACGIETPVCNRFLPSNNPGITHCTNTVLDGAYFCAHPKSCHQPQAQRREA